MSASLALARGLDRLGVPGGEPAGEALARRIAVTCVVAGIPVAAMLAVGAALGENAAGFVSNAGLAVWLGGAMFAYVVRPDARALAHVLLAGGQGSQLVAGLATGGLGASGVSPLWGLTAPLLSTIVHGPRAAFFWLVMHLLTVSAVALIDDDPTAAHTWLNVVLVSLFVYAGMATFVYQRDAALADAQRERNRADGLLFDVLPKSVANRLKRGDPVIDTAQSVAVMFADVAGFTSMTSTMPAGAVVSMLDAFFLAVDALAEQHGVEKVKTIGDCVMVMAGLPEHDEKPAVRLARFALALRDLTESRDFDGHRLTLRIGLHTGPAVASIVGKKRFLYDVWGDTVNTASRMESTGAPGRVQVSDAAHAEAGDVFAFEERGDVEVKGKGAMHTWWLVGAAAS